MNTLKEKLDRAESVAIILPNAPLGESVLAAFALKKSAGKKALIVGGGPMVQKHWAMVLDPTERAPREFALTINLAESPVEELRYEKIDGRLVVYLSSFSKIDKEQITLAESLPRVALAILVGFQSIEEGTATVAQYIASADEIIMLPSRASLLNAQEKEGGVGEVAIARPTDTAPQSEKHAPSIAGASPKLLARMTLRAREENAVNAIWTFVPADDFTKTESGAGDVPDAARALAALFPTRTFLVAFWQTGNNLVDGLIRATDEHALLALETLTESAHVDTFVRAPQFPNFSEAERWARGILREVTRRASTS